MCDNNNMKPLICYYCLDLSPDREAAIEASLHKLEQLMKRPPLEVDCPIAPLPCDIQGRIAEDMSRLDFGDCAAQMFCTMSSKASDGGPVPRLLVCCEAQHALTGKCRKACPSALWGLANGCIAVVYNLDNCCAIWHELLHTLTAEDCYALPNRGPTCEHPQCIMQYAATTGVVDGQLPLCRDNVDRVRSLFAKMKD